MSTHSPILPVLEIEKVSKSFGGINALDKCSFSVGKGSITALIGPNGSGKTTVFNVISRLVQEDTGVLKLKSEKIEKGEDYAVARRGVSRTFQQVRLFRNLTIRDHLEIAMSQDDESLWKSIFRPQSIVQDKIQEILRLVGLTKPLSTYATDLSYGQRKLLDLAMAIAKPHTILLLDEPVAGINPQLREKIKVILRRLHENGETILLIEHDMNFVMDLAQWIYVMDRGCVIAKGTPEQIRANPKVLEAYLGQ
ncbi:ABC transporter ATP-binding protein [Candidatus Woesearchaeota archaeon]|nr:ABC transporter ATP-binding protein [Candidatus Woesearchaeota archaeon]